MLASAATAAMGKKASLNDVLAKGKAKHQKAAEERRSANPGLPAVMDVPLGTKLPGGLTLKGFMKKHTVSYEEAVRVYKAFSEAAEIDDKKIAKYGLPTPVPTPARAGKKLPKGKGSEPEDAEDPAGSKASSKRKAKQQLALEDEEPEEPQVASKSSKKAKPVAEEGDVKPVKRALSFATPEKDIAPLSRATKKRGHTEAEISGAAANEADGGKIKRSNAAYLATPSSSEKPPKGILRGWPLSSIYICPSVVTLQ